MGTEKHWRNVHPPLESLSSCLPLARWGAEMRRPRVQDSLEIRYDRVYEPYGYPSFALRTP
jgi:hypothetical protein